MIKQFTLSTALLAGLLFSSLGYPTNTEKKLLQKNANSSKNDLKETFSSNIETLPGLFIGHDYKSVLQALQKNTQPIKDQFETTDKFDERIEKWKATKLYGEISQQSRFAFVLSITLYGDEVKMSYDADKLDMTFKISPSCDHNYGFIHSVNFEEMGSYVGENAFGVKRRINRSKLNYYCIITDEKIKYEYKTKIPTAEARETMQFARLLVIGKLNDDSTIYSSYLDSKPTINNPYERTTSITAIKLNIEEVWIFNSLNGEILSKHRIKKIKDAYLETEGSSSSENFIGGSWSDPGTEAIWSIFPQNGKWKLRIKQLDGSIQDRELFRYKKYSFEWVRNKKYTNMIYEVNDDGSLTLLHDGKPFQNMLPATR